MARQAIPLEGHAYHSKSDAQLHYIIKDASEAALCIRGHDRMAECKYLDQVNDACTVLNYRRGAATGPRSKVRQEVRTFA